LKKCLIIICIVNFFVLAQHFNYGNEVKKISFKKGNTHFDLSARINIPDMINKNKSAKYASQNNEFRIDSIYNRCVDNPDTKYIFNYRDGKLNKVFENIFFEDKWNKLFVVQFLYDTLGRNDTILCFYNRSVTDEEWINDQINTIQYDSAGNYSFTNKYLKWGEYVPNFKFCATLNNEQKPLHTISYNWVNGRWEISIKTDIYYNSDGVKDSTITKKSIDGVDVNLEKIIYNYDYFNLTSSELYQNWNTDQWVNNWQENYCHDGNWKQTSCISKGWDGNQWVPETRHFYYYNSNNFFIKGVCEAWSNGSWLPYDGSFYGDYSEVFGPVYKAAEITTYYSLPTNVKHNAEQIKGFELSPNYPNPFNPVTNIKFSIPENGAVELKVFDMLGQEISTLLNEYKVRGEYEIKFYASNLPSGVYLYRLKYSGAILSKKMLLQK